MSTAVAARDPEAGREREERAQQLEGAFANNDSWLLSGVIALLAIGLVMMTSASITIADRNHGDALYFLWRQLVALGIGLCLSIGVLRTPLELLQRLSSVLLLFALLLLVLVVVPGIGHEVNGSMRWMKIGPLTLQASEVAKPCVVLYLAAYIVRHGDQVRTQFIGFIKPILVLMIIAVLLLLEPDYGAAAVLFTTCLGMLFLAGVSLQRFVLWGIVAVAALATVAMLKAYRLTRLMTFTDPWADPYDTGFQLTQALIAFGRGEWLGVGLGSSIQKMFYLPEVHTDFVFAVIAEELGIPRHRDRHSAVPVRRMEVFPHRWRGPPQRQGLPVLHCQRRGPAPGAAGIREHRREHGRPADQGPAAALHKLRIQQSHDELRGGGPGLAGRLREPAAAAGLVEEGAACELTSRQLR